jgi:hypothetical protein
MRFKSSVLILLAVCSPTSWAIASGNIQPYHATYNVKMLQPLKARGKVTRDLRQVGQQTYQFTEHMKGQGLLAPIVNMALQKEQKNYAKSIFTIKGTDIFPTEYTRGDEIFTITHDKICSKNSASDCQTSAGNHKIYDPYSVQTQYNLYLKQHTKGKAAPMTYAVKDNSINLTTFTVTRTHQTIKLNDTAYQTIQVTMTELGKNRYTNFWLSPSMHYIPVKIERYKNNKKQMIITLTHYKTK